MIRVDMISNCETSNRCRAGLTGFSYDPRLGSLPRTATRGPEIVY